MIWSSTFLSFIFVYKSEVNWFTLHWIQSRIGYKFVRDILIMYKFQNELVYFLLTNISSWNSFFARYFSSFSSTLICEKALVYMLECKNVIYCKNTYAELDLIILKMILCNIEIRNNFQNARSYQQLFSDIQ